ncbi:MAG: hypothetical protein CMJ83_15390 [Planctomycetes bacterium]|nr:hypothetical protein [Planctomycetota bacterium]
MRIAVLLMATGLATAQNQGITLSNLTPTNYVEVPGHPSQVPLNGFTFEAWVTYDDTTVPVGTGVRWPTICRKNPAQGSSIFHLRANAGGNSATVIRFRITTSAGNRILDWPFASGALLTWTHLAASYDGAMMRIFVNGVDMVSTTHTGVMNDTGGTFRIGAGGATAWHTWNGQIDEVRLWPYARTAAEIQSTLGLELSSVPSGVSTWNLNGNFADSSGPNPGAAVGTVPFASGVQGLIASPSGAVAVGASSNTCVNPVLAGIASLPTVGNPAFGLTASGGPPNAAGLLAISDQAFAGPVVISGVTVWVDVTRPGAQIIPVTNGPFGSLTYPIPLPPNPGLAGFAAFVQWAWADPNCGSAGLTGSNALRITLLP